MSPPVLDCSQVDIQERPLRFLLPTGLEVKSKSKPRIGSFALLPKLQAFGCYHVLPVVMATVLPILACLDPASAFRQPLCLPGLAWVLRVDSPLARSLFVIVSQLQGFVHGHQAPSRATPAAPWSCFLKYRVLLCSLNWPWVLGSSDPHV